MCLIGSGIVLLTTLKKEVILSVSANQQENYTREYVQLFRKYVEREGLLNANEYGRLLFLMRRTNRYERFEEITDNAIRWCANDSFVMKKVGWIYYSKYVKTGERRRRISAAQFIVNNTKLEDKFSPYIRTVLRMIKYFHELEEYSKVLEWAELLDYRKLPDTARVYSNESGVMALPSDRVEYALKKSHALMKLKKYRDTVRFLEEVLSSGVCGRDVKYLKFRLAKAYYYLRSFDKALELFKALRREREEWYIDAYISDIFYTQNEKEKALKYAIYALLEKGDLHMKKRMIDRVLSMTDDKDARKKEIKKILSKIEEGMEMNSTEKRRAEAIFRSYLPVRTGHVVHVMLNGCGFIRDDNGDEYFFPGRDYPGTPVKGERVSFVLWDSFDKRKNRPSKIARLIRVMKS